MTTKFFFIPFFHAALASLLLFSSASAADRFAGVDYYNAVSAVLDQHPYTLPGLCHASAHEYLRNWRLEAVPGFAANSLTVAAGRLAPPRGIFDGQTAEQLARLVAAMGQNLEEVVKEYRRLDTYVRDDSIADDGAQGKKIVAGLDAAYGKFIAARDDFLKLADERSAREEEEFLQNHPLRRQIVQAREIFAIFRQCASLLGAEDPGPAVRLALARLGEKLDAALADAGSPPFRGSPALEREYRAFLREAGRYAEALARGQAENFSAASRRAMNAAVAASRGAYNAFAKSVN